MVIVILKRQNQLKIRWTTTLNLVFKIINEKFASSVNYNECNVSKQSQKYSVKMKINKVKTLTFKWTSLLGKSQRLEVAFGLFRLSFTLPKLKQKEPALKATKILQLNWNCTRHFMEHGRAYIKNWFMIFVHDYIGLARAHVIKRFCSWFLFMIRWD